MRHAWTVALCLAMVGCATSRLPTVPPSTLQDVNDELRGAWAIIYHVDGSRIRRIRNVHVGSAYTSFYSASDRGADSLLTAEVRSVALTAEHRVGPHALLLASPGLIATGFGALTLLDANAQSENMASGIIGASFLMLGGTAAMFGAGLGAMLGTSAAERGAVVVYEGPLSRYDAP